MAKGLEQVAIRAEAGSAEPAYGWVNVGCMLVLLALGNGLVLGGVTVFDETLLRELHISIGTLKFRDLIGLFCSGLSAPMIGYAVDRVGVRPVIAFGLTLIAASMLFYAQVTDVVHVYLIHAALGIAFAATNIVVILVLLSQWFDSRRGMALGITLAGTSVGGTLFPQLVAELLTNFDWRTSFRLLALAPVLYFPVLLLLVRERRAPIASVSGLSVSRVPIGFRQIASRMLTPEFFALSLVAIAVFYSANTFTRHSFLFLRMNGADLAVAAAGISTVFMFGLIGKVASGFLLQVLGLRTVFIAYQILTLCGAVMLATFGVEYKTLALACIGLGWGGSYTLIQLTASRYFTGPHMGQLLGGFVVIESLSQGLGSWVSGLLADAFRGYTVAFSVVIGLMIMSVLITATNPAFAEKSNRQPKNVRAA